MEAHGDDAYLSDCASGTSMADNIAEEQKLYLNRFTRVSDGVVLHETISKKLISQLSSCGYRARIEGIRRNSFATKMSRAKLQSFRIYAKAMDGIEKYAWYGASTDMIRDVVHHGFCSPDSKGGVHLYPLEQPLNSVLSATPDADGVRHMLLCRVLLGKSEVVCLNSGQYKPSSPEFDSGVDNLSSPQKYIIWSSHMNTHILPEFMVTLRASPYCQECKSSVQPRKPLPTSDWVPFSTLTVVLSKFLPREAINSIAKLHCDYKKHKMSRREMVQRVRDIAGDKLLLEIIRSYRGKKAPFCKGNMTSSFSLETNKVDKGITM